MRAIAVDDNRLSLDILLTQLNALAYFESVQGFTDPQEAVGYIREHPVDMAFLDIMMNGIDGITLAGVIRTYIPACYVIFTTASADYALDAYKVHAAGYLVKPVTKESLREQLDAISAYLTKPQAPAGKCLRVQCFGNFEAFDAEGKPLSFHYKKTKELLAYLVHRRGAICSNAEIAAVLYEDRDDTGSLQSQVRNLIGDLSKTLRDINAQAAFYKERGGTAVVPDEIDCDFYDYMKNGSSSAFHGEYLSQYDWAEEVTAYLNRNRG